MTRHDPTVRVRHMRDHACEAVEMARGRSRADLDADRQLNLALVRLMEVVGEAAARVPEEFRRQHPELPWQDIADLRNRLIHGYDMVNLDVLWAIIQEDLPPLVAQLQVILDDAS
jgi:uncharacterized protein with HEPN domain